MNEFLSHFGIYLTSGTTIIFGAIAIYGLFDKTSRERRKETDGAEDRLINLLKAEVAELTKKVDKQDDDIQILSLEVEKLKKENHVLSTVLQGRDDSTRKFQDDAYLAFEQIKTMGDNLTRLVTVFESYMRTK